MSIVITKHAYCILYCIVLHIIYFRDYYKYKKYNLSELATKDVPKAEDDLNTTEPDLKPTEADLTSAQADKVEGIENSNGDSPKEDNAAVSADQEAGSCITKGDIQNNGCETAEDKVKEAENADDNPETLNK